MGPVRQPSDDYSNYILSTDKKGKEVNLFQPASEFLPMIDEVFNSLVNITEEIQGAKVENNKFCVSVHFRNVDGKEWTTVAQRVHDVIRNYPRLRLTNGRKVLREGNRGYGILVSSVPKESNAFFSLKDPQEVMEFLQSPLVWKEKTSTV